MIRTDLQEYADLPSSIDRTKQTRKTKLAVRKSTNRHLSKNSYRTFMRALLGIAIKARNSAREPLRSAWG